MLRLPVCYLLFAFLLLPACASLTHRPVASFADHPGGIPYYRGAHYLLVHTDGKGGLVSKLLLLPDPNRRMVAHPRQLFARLDTTLRFSHGVLTRSKEEGDTTAVPKAVIEALGKVAPALMASLANQMREEGRKPGYTLPPPHLYRVTWDAGELHLVGGPGDEEIAVTLVPGTKANGK